MRSTKYPGPTTPFYKGEGKWTFYVFPKGAQEEAGVYRDEESARIASWEAHRAWQANGRSYGTSPLPN
jgi:hypothetical protein